jgi:hypothetical protein
MKPQTHQPEKQGSHWLQEGEKTQNYIHDTRSLTLNPHQLHRDKYIVKYTDGYKHTTEKNSAEQTRYSHTFQPQIQPKLNQHTHNQNNKIKYLCTQPTIWLQIPWDTFTVHCAVRKPANKTNQQNQPTKPMFDFSKHYPRNGRTTLHTPPATRTSVLRRTRCGEGGRGGGGLDEGTGSCLG